MDTKIITNTELIKEFRDFKQFLDLPWKEGAFCTYDKDSQVISVYSLAGDKILLETFTLLAFHKVCGYGSLRWRNVFNWITRYLFRCQTFALSNHLDITKELEKVFTLEGQPWNATCVNDLVFELIDVHNYFPSITFKGLGDKIYFTEIGTESSSGSMYERVWGGTYICPDPSASKEGAPSQPPVKI